MDALEKRLTDLERKVAEMDSQMLRKPQPIVPLTKEQQEAERVRLSQDWIDKHSSRIA